MVFHDATGGENFRSNNTLISLTIIDMILDYYGIRDLTKYCCMMKNSFFFFQEDCKLASLLILSFLHMVFSYFISIIDLFTN